MPGGIEAIQHLLSCPDDGQPLRLVGGQLLCGGCGRKFPVHQETLAEILPSRPLQLPASVAADYRNAYLALFEERFQNDDSSLAWGAEEAAPADWIAKRLRQVQAMRPLVTVGTSPASSVLCDIAAGAGHYTFAYTSCFRFVLHCDLSVQNLNYVRRKARERNADGMVFLRIDYFQPPFRHSVDRLLCLDTLIRGEEHDSMLLKSIGDCLLPAGKAVIDFHNWWHNPLRRLGLLPENFHNNRSYRRPETTKLLREAAFQNATEFPFVQEFVPGGRLDRLCSRAVPSTRIVYRVGRDAGVPRKTESAMVEAAL